MQCMCALSMTGGAVHPEDTPLLLQGDIIMCGAEGGTRSAQTHAPAAIIPAYHQALICTSWHRALHTTQAPEQGQSWHCLHLRC